MPAIFAIPGDIHRRTGGFIYEARVLRELGLRHLPLPAGFPDPTPAEMAEAVARLAACPATGPVILDGLVCGAIDPAGLARMAAPLVAMIHHPLALETGLDPARARHLRRTETANLARAAHVLVPSPHTARILAADYGVAPGRITVAPPGFDRPPPAMVAKAEPPLILSVGLIAERKGHDVLLPRSAGCGTCPGRRRSWVRSSTPLLPPRWRCSATGWGSRAGLPFAAACLRRRWRRPMPGRPSSRLPPATKATAWCCRRRCCVACRW